VEPTGNVLFIGHDASRTGAPLLLLEFIKWLKAHSSIKPFALLKRGGELEPDYQALAATGNLDEQFEMINRGFHRRLLRKLRLTTLRQPDLAVLYPVKEYPVVYANTIDTCGVASQLAGSGRRIIHHVHELSYITELFDADGALKKAVPVTFAYIAASHSVREYLERSIGVPARKIHVVHEFPIATKIVNDYARQAVRRELGIPNDGFVVGMCGLPQWRKGTDLFVQLAMQVQHHIEPDKCHFVWLGGNAKSHREALHDVAKLGLQEICHFIQAVPDSEAYFSAFDVFALTSREDPFSVAMLEAAAGGLPIVCFADAGGAPELVENDAGIVVPYLDVPAMAKACAELLADEGRRKQMGQNAQAKVRGRYALDRQAPKLLAVIEEAMGRAANGN
jgi:glycosyltransferase involved in cell wall biosynthesis